MILSMTGFARKKVSSHWGDITCEIRSVNHRFCEISLKTADIFRPYERSIREAAQKKLMRGKIDIFVRYEPNENLPYDLVINEALARQVIKIAGNCHEKFSSTQLEVMQLLNWPGILRTEETHVDDLAQAMLDLLAQTIEELTQARQKEGERLKQYLMDRLELLLQQMQIVEAKLPEIYASQRDRLHAKLSEIKATINPDRLEQEMLIFAQKTDVSEELERLASHIQAIRDFLVSAGAVGRKLDFYLQELNREANTLASKSVNALMSQAAIEMKVVIEQMREQVQNIE